MVRVKTVFLCSCWEKRVVVDDRSSVTSSFTFDVFPLRKAVSAVVWQVTVS